MNAPTFVGIATIVLLTGCAEPTQNNALFDVGNLVELQVYSRECQTTTYKLFEEYSLCQQNYTVAVWGITQNAHPQEEAPTLPVEYRQCISKARSEAESALNRIKAECTQKVKTTNDQLSSDAFCTCPYPYALST